MSWGETTSRARQRPVDRRSRPLPQSDYGFLLGRSIDTATLARAEEIARRSGVYPHEVLIANGWLRADDYYRALAQACALPFKREVTAEEVAPPSAGASPGDCLASGLLKERAHAGRLVLAPDRLPPNALREVLARLRPSTLALAPPQAVHRAIYGHFAARFAHGAVEGLSARYPDQSARAKLAAWQLVSLGLAGGAWAAALLLWPVAAIRVVSLGLALIFVPVIALRLIAARDLLFGLHRGADRAGPRIPDAELPVYTVLVPLYREANVLASLAQVLARLDYPAPKLDIKLILEEVDAETIRAARALDLPGNVEIVLVPDLVPRTKPKALNYALPLARGDYLVIYDAEDRPERDQLRRALAAFRDGPPNLACVQAALNIYNASDSWLTRQFALEYCTLFDGLLPVLDRLDLPIPLGGTSNHFRVAALKWLMAWDPFNVTEDADLGMRLARHSYRCKALASTTYEEAPGRLMPWLRQRTRWLKGFVQTWLVHMRSPATLWREMGARGFCTLQIVIGGTVLSALVHPWFYVLAGFDLARATFLDRPGSLLGWPFWLIAWFDLITGYLASMAVGLLAARRRGDRDLLPQVLLMPLYWLLISAAAYRALWQFVTARFEWEKTEHGLAQSMEMRGLDIPKLDRPGPHGRAN